MFHNIGVLKTCYLENLFLSVKKVLVLTKQIEKNWFYQVPILKAGPFEKGP